ncbi:MAG TPA: DUF4097 family beta strand repeat-containing protein [Candidatus Marinimicrobia bacterium]|nr:DUF4097 family beta strand repeat-containing protein [Candidatus Neomarinimicrobiota bacterium]HRS50865.1 DUF4097 family beta strand repeat-containing protein [Candidatus Neomarinimicrobiota bacterium]HRU91793.1 DUF4097 family beta strand repeat-containing protein [Candidatus Neomarinimicrobiota bacterium]
MKPKLSFLILLMMISIGAAPDQLEFDGRQYVGDIVKIFAVGSKGELIMERVSGDVTIEGEARQDVMVIEKFKIDAYSEANARQILNEEKARFQQRGNKVTVTGKEHSRRYSSDFIVKVPFNFNTTVQTSGGDISITEVIGLQNLNTSGGDIEISECKGDLKSNTSGGDIKIKRFEGNLNVNTSSGDIDINSFNGELWATTSGGDITLDRIQVNGQVNTSGGDIDIVNLRAKTFSARTSGGDIGADKVEAELTLNTSGGDIVIGQIEGNVEIHTSGGDIEVRQINKNLKATTSGGDINVGLVKGYCYVRTSGGNIEVDRAYDLEAITSGGDILADGIVGYIYARTSGGDIEARKLFKPDVKNNAIDLETSGGEIEVVLPANLNANIDAEITVTSRRYADVNIHSDFPIQKSHEIKGSRIYIYARGKINKGGDLVRLRTVNGNINIVKGDRELR